VRAHVWWICDCEARNGTSVSSLSSSIINLGGMLRDESGRVAMLAAVTKRLEMVGTMSSTKLEIAFAVASLQNCAMRRGC
jgi:hypothetical protein